MNWIINYLLSGILAMWVLDYISHKVSNNPNQLFTKWERVILVIGWPVYLTTFIVMFILTFFKK